MGHPEDCSLAYSFTTPEDLRDYYDGIASYYNSFLESNDYVLHENVVEIFNAQWKDLVGNVLDVCCGSGKLGIEIRKIMSPKLIVDGLDFSSNMIETAERWGVYNAFHNFNLKEDLSLISQKYDVLVSSGAFTPNHLGADDLIRITSLLNPSGHVFIAVKKDLFEEGGFDARLQIEVENGSIGFLMYTEVPIWDNPDFTDTAIVVNFQKN